MNDNLGSAAGALAAYGEPRAVPALLKAFDDLELEADDALATLDMVELENAIHDLGGRFSPEQRRKYETAMLDHGVTRKQIRRHLREAERRQRKH